MMGVLHCFSYGFVHRARVGEPKLFEDVSSFHVVKAGSLFEDDDIQVYPGKVYRGTMDEE